MKAIVIEEYQSNLAEMLKSLQVKELPLPEPDEDQVVIKIQASPCNPSDIAFLRGMYAIKKTLPVVPGFEGTGIVIDAGKNSQAQSFIGKRVSCFSQDNSNGSWAEYFTTSWKNCIPVKNEMPIDQAACFFVNPFTAFGLVERAKELGATTIIQNAAAGQVGAFVRKIAEKDNIRTINIVRRPAHLVLLKSVGEKYVLNQRDKNFDEEFKSVVNELKPTVAFDAVAGEHSGFLLNNMPPGSKLIVYGGLSGLAASGFDILELIFNSKSVEGFNLGRWASNNQAESFRKVSDYLQNLVISGQVTTKIQRSISYSEVYSGFYQYVTKMSDGKVLLKP